MKKNKKKFLSLGMVLLMSLGLFACEKEIEKNESTINASSMETESLPTPTDASFETKEEKLQGSISKELLELENEAAALEEKLQNAMTQTDMNVLSGELYLLWDNELNDLWKRIKEKNTKEEMDKLLDEERQWIKDKEAKVKKAGAEFEGGSIQPLIENQEATNITKERVYELAKILGKLTNEEVVIPASNITSANATDTFGEDNIFEYGDSKCGNNYMQTVAGNIVEGKQWKYEFENNNMRLDDELVNFYDLESKTEVGDFFDSFRAVNPGKETMTWTLYDTKTGEVHYVGVLEFEIKNEKDNYGFYQMKLKKMTVSDSRTNDMRAYRFDEPELNDKGEGNG